VPSFVPCIRSKCIWGDFDTVDALPGRIVECGRGFPVRERELVRKCLLQRWNKYVWNMEYSLTRGAGVRLPVSTLGAVGLLDREIHYLSHLSPQLDRIPPREVRAGGDRPLVGWKRVRADKWSRTYRAEYRRACVEEGWKLWEVGERKMGLRCMVREWKVWKGFGQTVSREDRRKDRRKLLGHEFSGTSGKENIRGWRSVVRWLGESAEGFRKGRRLDWVKADEIGPRFAELWGNGRRSFVVGLL